MSDINDNPFFYTNKEDIEGRGKDAVKPRKYIHKYRNKITGEEKTAVFLNPKRGNKMFAYLTQDKFDNAVRLMKEKVDEESGAILQITLTGEYDPMDIDDIFDSWMRMKKKYWPRFYRWLRRKGFSSFISTNEAHENGGCHINLVIYYKNELESVTDKNRETRMKDKKFEREIEGAWRHFSGGIAHIQVVDNLSSATGYISKELGRESAIDGALERSIRNWKNESDKKKRNDIKKLNGWYIAEVLNLRRWNMSRDLSREVAAEVEVSEVEALDNIVIGNSTDTIEKINTIGKKRPEKSSDWERVERVSVPSFALKKGLFSKLGWIDNNSPEYTVALRLFDLKGEKIRYKPKTPVRYKPKLPVVSPVNTLAMEALA